MSNNKTIADIVMKRSTQSEQSIPDTSGIKKPKMKHQWRLALTGIMSDLNLAMQIISCSRPTVIFDEVEIPHTDDAGITTTVYTVGKHQWVPLTIVVEDDATGDAARTIQQQLANQQQANPSNFIDCKFDIDIEYLDGHNNVTDTWSIQGCWLQQVDYTSLDYSVSEPVQIELTIRYDHATMVIPSTDGCENSSSFSG